jgi:hypothetical protein
MPLGSVLYESGSMLDHVYFPATAIISLLYVLGDGCPALCALAYRGRAARPLNFTVCARWGPGYFGARQASGASRTGD